MESGALWLSPLVGFGFLSGRWGEEWYGVKKSLIDWRGLFVRLTSYLNHIKVNITSLNSHFPHQGPQPKMLKRKKQSQKTPHFLSSNQDIVARSQKEKRELKHVTHSPKYQPELQI
jgi:hypothetical protein